MQRTLFIFLKIWVSNLTRKISLTLDVFRRFTYLVFRDNQPQYLRKDLKMLAPSERNTLRKKFWTNTKIVKLLGVISARLKTYWLKVFSTETYHSYSSRFLILWCWQGNIMIKVKSQGCVPYWICKESVVVLVAQCSLRITLFMKLIENLYIQLLSGHIVSWEIIWIVRSSLALLLLDSLWNCG